MKKTVMTLPIVLMIFMMVSCAGSNPPVAPAGSTVDFQTSLDSISLCSVRGSEPIRIGVTVTGPDGNLLNGVEVEYHLGFANRNANLVDTDNDGIGNEPLLAFLDRGVYRSSPFRTTTDDRGVAEAWIDIPGFLNLRRGELSQEGVAANPVTLEVFSGAVESEPQNFEVNDGCGEDG